MLNLNITNQEIIRRYKKSKNDLIYLDNHNYSRNGISLFFIFQNILGRGPSSSEIALFINKLKMNQKPKKLTKLILYSCESLIRNHIPPSSVYFSFFDLMNTPIDIFISNLVIKILGRNAHENELILWKKRLKYTNRFVVFILFLRIKEYKNNYKFFVISETSFRMFYKLKMYLYSIKYFIKGNPNLFNRFFRKKSLQ
jgi:hypothetical protein